MFVEKLVRNFVTVFKTEKTIAPVKNFAEFSSRQ